MSMIEFLWGLFTLLARAAIFVFETIVFVSNLKRLARFATGTDKLIDVPRDPKTHSPAAQRALDETEQRRTHAAHGGVRAS